ncbi:hypothetical protein OTU49_012452, partial [Cherax quadricarinatus]
SASTVRRQESHPPPASNSSPLSLPSRWQNNDNDNDKQKNNDNQELCCGFSDDNSTQNVKPCRGASEPSTGAFPGEALKAYVEQDIKTSESATPPRSPFRGRASTNESTKSTNSSSKSDSESSEKKSKFKLFKSKLSVNKKEDKDSKDGKERKRKGSTFSLLQVKKSKERAKKGPDDLERESAEALVNVSQQPADTARGYDAVQTALTETAAITAVKDANIFVLQSDVLETEKDLRPDTGDSVKQDSHSVSTDIVDSVKQDSSCLSTDVTDSVKEDRRSLSPDVTIVLRREKLHSNGEARCSTYSRASNSSRDQEPAPSIPEKTRVRAKSPNHDIPQSNRPVTHMYRNIQQEQELEDNKQVDGYITEEQIHAILTASESRDKKRHSQSHSFLLTVTDISKGSEDWSFKRPSFESVNSTESDEPLAVTNFLSSDRHSNSSGSLKTRSKSLDSNSSSESPVCKESQDPEQDTSAVHLRKLSRPTDSLMATNRVSLTCPEFTVLEEDGVTTPDATKTSFPTEVVPPGSPSDVPRIRVATGVEPGVDLQQSPSLQTTLDSEEEDYFPVPGVQMRTVPGSLVLAQSSKDLRTSGILELKEYLKKEGQQEVKEEVKAGISRLGHSPAVEKLKNTSENLS